MIGRCGEEELLLAGGTVVAGTVKPQCPLEVQQLTHEVEIGGNVGLLPLDKVIGVVEGEVESLHQVGDGDGDGAADAGQAVDQDAALLRSSLVCVRSKQTHSYKHTVSFLLAQQWYKRLQLLGDLDRTLKNIHITFSYRKEANTCRTPRLTCGPVFKHNPDSGNNISFHPAPQDAM